MDFPKKRLTNIYKVAYALTNKMPLPVVAVHNDSRDAMWGRQKEIDKFQSLKKSSDELLRVQSICLFWIILSMSINACVEASGQYKSVDHMTHISQDTFVCVHSKNDPYIYGKNKEGL